MKTNRDLTMRRYRDDDDFWRMRAFLREVFLLNDRLERSWSLPRLDYWRWHFIQTCESDPMEQVTILWETSDGRLAAVLHPIMMGEAYLQVHPHFRSAALEDEMFACAEKLLSSINAAGERRLFVLADEDDKLRREVLKARGYTYRDQPVYRWRRDLDDKWTISCLKRISHLDTRSARWETPANTMHEPGLRGALSIQMNPMTVLMAGIGTPTCSLRRSTGAIWISSPRRPMARSLRFLRSGMTM